MAQYNVIKNETVVAVVAESTEGTAVDPSGATDYVEVKSDGLEGSYEREELVRDTLGSTIEAEASRLGIATVNSSLPLELRTGDSAGDYPEAELLLESLLGGKRQAVSDTTTTGNTSTVLEFGATPPFAVGDCVLVKESGAFEVRPISAVGATTITFPFALDNGAPSDGVVVEAVSTFYHGDLNATSSLTVTNYMGNEIKKQMAGMRVGSMALEGWETGQVPGTTFNMTGTDMTEADGAAPHTPSYVSALPPVALSACFWLSGSKLGYNALSLNIENELSPIPSACAESGKVGNRYIAQSVTMQVNPYKDDTTTTVFDNFKDNDDVSAFAYIYNPSSTTGEFSNAIALWIPQGKITVHTDEDVNGVYADQVTIKAHRSSGNDSFFMSFI